MWKARRKLQATDFGVEIHGLCANVVELFGTFDQLDLCNLAGAEKLVRQMQMTEHLGGAPRRR
eukprot:7274997-Lingulodinium_polyedra.AAC.1